MQYALLNVKLFCGIEKLSDDKQPVPLSGSPSTFLPDFAPNAAADCHLSEHGNRKMPAILDDQATCRLYEHFILEHYRREHPELDANASQVPWALDDDVADFLPVMQTDVTLRQNDRVLVIDAKYYTHMMQANFDTATLHSGNLYQIFTYVKNMQQTLPTDAPAVAGMLLYARTDEPLLPDGDYRMSGNPISVRSLDLSCDFERVRAQLDEIVATWF